MWRLNVGGGGGAGSVYSINGKTGAVTLSQDQIHDGIIYKRVSKDEKDLWNCKMEGTIFIDRKLTAGSIISVQEDGMGYRVEGDLIPLGSNSANFNNNKRLKFYLNGLLQRKGIDIIWLNPTQFSYVGELDIHDEIIVRLE